jgi:23S rRNA (guanine2445-N2)-methyltransferase / 23S rRNA (guanine2069-N7)-methyltransferase
VTVPLQDFANRLRKMARHHARWARRQGVDAFRVYDRDVPGYRYAIDVYETEPAAGGTLLGRCVHVQEFAGARDRSKRSATASDALTGEPPRLTDVVACVRDVLEVDDAHVFCKRRRRQTDMAQYQRLGARGREAVVREAGLRFLVNFTDHLDTGLFLDHRPTRAWVREVSGGARVLNLFAYTGSFTVHAIAGGARSTTTVDLSRTYLAWARRNLRLNGYDVSESHRLVRADVLGWLRDGGEGGPYDLVVLDPPTHSRSKRMDRDLAIQRDHPELILACARLLAPGGTLLFSTNYRKFRLEAGALPGLRAKDVSARTTPADFQRHPAHQAWWIQRA